VPKVVVIVGPAGDLTDGFRTQAEAAARAAEAEGAQVVRVYSPNATWPAVQQATDGASIVVYLGHGNGFPSPYGDVMRPRTQNGFGLNPVGGQDDVAHQYFGEASIAGLRLAPNAVVLLHHLCYASGNPESGQPEATPAEAIARVDNFAAGFLRAGARAVVAEGHLGPAYYVRALLTSSLSIEGIWQRSPAAHRNAFAIASVRSPGYTARLDPDTPAGGYFRSLVSAGLTAAAVRSGAQGDPGAVWVGPAQPSLGGLGLRFGMPALRDLPVAGATTTLTLPLDPLIAARLPSGTEVGVRWAAILLDPVSPGSSPSPGADPGASPYPSASPSVDPAGTAPDVELVVPEQQGSLVTPAPASVTAAGLELEVAYPSAPGLYRLVATLHTPSGVAYDAATQALLTPVIVRVSGPVGVAYGAPAALTLPLGTRASVAVRVINSGTVGWDVAAALPRSAPADDLLGWLRTGRLPAHLVATWVSTTGSAVPAPAWTVLDAETSAPGGEGTVLVWLTTPAAPGDYLLLLDVVSPARGALSSLGAAPGLIRVTVTDAVAPSPGDSPALPERRG
jgi:hypothetical protein